MASANPIHYAPIGLDGQPTASATELVPALLRADALTATADRFLGTAASATALCLGWRRCAVWRWRRSGRTRA